MLQKQLRRLIQQRPSRQIRTTRNPHHVPVHQCLQRSVHTHPPHRLNPALRHRLPVRNDRQRLQRTRRQSLRLLVRKQLPHPLRPIRTTHNPPPGRPLHQLKRTPALDILQIQPPDRRPNVLLRHRRMPRHTLRRILTLRLPHRRHRRLHAAHQFLRRRPFRRRKNQPLDNAVQLGNHVSSDNALNSLTIPHLTCSRSGTR